MKKIIIILGLILFNTTFAFAQKLPEFSGEYYENYEKLIVKEKYMDYENYIQDYYKTIAEQFKPKGKFPKYSLLAANIFIRVNKDGTILTHRIFQSSIGYAQYLKDPIRRKNSEKYAEEFVQYITNIILDNPPKPFPEDFEHERFVFDIWFGYTPLNPITYHRVKNDPKIKYMRGELMGGNNSIVPPNWEFLFLEK